MSVISIIFWMFLVIVLYTFLGYGLLLYVLVKLKQIFAKPKGCSVVPEYPDVTLFITAYNEEAVVDDKMLNCRLLDYPKEKLHILWVTDGSDDATNQKLSKWEDAIVSFEPERRGKMYAMNRGMQQVKTPLVIFTDANTTLNKEAVKEIIKCFGDPKVGCVAGEKRIAPSDRQSAAQGGEGLYWKYESALKALDDQLYSTVGAAGEPMYSA